MALGINGLLKPGDRDSWLNALERFIATKQAPARFDRNAIPTILQMTREVQAVYQTVISPEAR